MRTLPTLLTFLSLIGLSLLLPASPVRLRRRDAAIRDSPSGNYLPVNTNCPAGLAVRRPGNLVPLNVNEAAYIKNRTAASTANWKAYLKNVGLNGLDVAAFVPPSKNAIPGVTLPLIGFATSGGGSRALLVGGGILRAFDGRNTVSGPAKTNGILQLAQYHSALSGGAWLAGSWALAAFPQFEALREQVWDLYDYLVPINTYSAAWSDACNSMRSKRLKGYPVSAIDAWGRFLSYHTLNDTNNPFGPGSATLWSSIREQPRWKLFEGPFPIVLTIGREAIQGSESLTSPVYEITPYEFGSYDPTLAPGAFLTVDWLGSEFMSGQPSNRANCVEGFENAGYIMGSSSDAAGFIDLNDEPSPPPGDECKLSDEFNLVDEHVLFTARVPNPFKGLNQSTYKASNDVNLHLIDGGLANENIPFAPLVQSRRLLDVIIAVDASADTSDYWPNGTEIYNTYLKSQLPGYSYPFPFIPPPEVFVGLGLNKKPVFFGSDCTGQKPDTPLIVYFPNYDITFPTNTYTLRPFYFDFEQRGFFDNSLHIATQSFSGAWGKCLACALVDRQLRRNGIPRSSQCSLCFQQNCYLGTQDDVHGTAAREAILQENIHSTMSGSPTQPDGVKCSRTFLSQAFNLASKFMPSWYHYGVFSLAVGILLLVLHRLHPSGEIHLENQVAERDKKHSTL